MKNYEININDAIKNDIQVILANIKSSNITLTDDKNKETITYITSKKISKIKNKETLENYHCSIKNLRQNVTLSPEEYYKSLSTQQKHEITKYYIEEENQIYTLKNCYYTKCNNKRISNCIINLKEKLINEHNEILYNIDIINTYYQKKSVNEVLPEVFTSSQKIKSFLSKQGNFIIKANDKQLQDIIEIILNQECNEVKIIAKLGFDNKCGWLYEEIKNNNVILSDTTVYDGEKPHLYTTHNLDIINTADKFSQISTNSHSLFGFLYCISCLFYNEIMTKYKSFPFLFITGKSQAGKTNYAKLLMQLFGFKNADGLVYPASTKVGLLNSLQELGSIPLWIEEYDGNNIKIPDDIFKSIYNGSAGTKGKIGGTTSYKISSPLIFTGETSFETESIINRCITIIYNKTNDHIFYNLRDSHLSNIIFQIISNKHHLTNIYLKEIDYWIKNINADTRISFNLSVILSTFKLLNIKPDLTLCNNFIETQKNIIEKEDILYKFFENILVCLDYHYINSEDIQRCDNFIFIYFKGVYESIKKHIDKDIYKKETIQNYIKNSHYYIDTKSHRFTKDKVRYAILIDANKCYKFFADAINETDEKNFYN